MKVEVLKLRQQVVFLRQQQLQDWRQLRNFHESSQAKAAYLWISDLMLILQGIIDQNQMHSSCSHADYDSALSKDRIQMLWTYLEKHTLMKSIGEFDTRIQVVQVLSQLLRQESSNKKVVQLGCVLGHYCKYIELVRPRVDLVLSCQRKVMDKEIQTLLKVTRWDISQHEALRESIHKAHYQLGKAIKKFSSFLQETTVGYLTPKSSEDNETTGKILARSILRHTMCNFEDMDKVKRIMLLTSEEEEYGDYFKCCSAGMLEWVKSLGDEIRISVSAIDTLTSIAKKRLATELRNRLMAELKLELLVSISYYCHER